MRTRKVIIDTDPGVDDLLALYLACKHDDIEILAISTVFGNVDLSKTTKNANLFLNILGNNIPLIKGSESPLFYKRKLNANVHGDDGLGNLYNEFNKDVKMNIIEKHEFQKLREIILKNDYVDIIAIGPLTNIAKLIVTDDTIKKHINSIHIMGGGIKSSNKTKFSEFNFYSDSYAANIVLNSDIPKYISTLDTTSDLYFEKNEFSINNGNKLKELVTKSIEYYISQDPYLHDVSSVLTLTNPELFEFEEVDIDVIVSNNLQDGQSFRTGEKTKNTYLAKVKSRKDAINLVDNYLKK